jgi:hypothetical protein
LFIKNSVSSGGVKDHNLKFTGNEVETETKDCS